MSSDIRHIGKSLMPRLLSARGAATMVVLLLILAGLSGVMAIGNQKVVLRDGRLHLTTFGRQVPDGIAFSFDGRDVSIDELNQSVRVLHGLYGVTAPTNPQKLNTYRRQTAKAVAVSKVLAAVEDRRGISVPGSQVQSQLTALIKSAYGGSHDKFVSALAAKGVSEDDVRNEIRNQLRNLALFAAVTKHVRQPTTAEVNAYFAQHRKEFVTPEQRKISNIVVASKKDADVVLRYARRGVSFGRLASRYSLDRATRTKGGRLGSLARGQLETGYGKTAFSVKTGQPFGPVKTKSGWNVGVVTQVIASHALPRSQVTASIKSQLSDQARLKKWEGFLAEQIKSADVVYADAYRPANPDAPPSNKLTSPGANPMEK